VILSLKPFGANQRVNEIDREQHGKTSAHAIINGHDVFLLRLQAIERIGVEPRQHEEREGGSDEYKVFHE
jgi:hypothetical protein